MNKSQVQVLKEIVDGLLRGQNRLFVPHFDGVALIGLDNNNYSILGKYESIEDAKEKLDGQVINHDGNK